MRLTSFLACLFAGIFHPAGDALAANSLKQLFELSKADGVQMQLPTDIAVATDGRIFVVDSGNDRVVVYDDAGRFLYSFGKTGNGAGQLESPIGIALDRQNSVYIADTHNQRIQVFTTHGTFLGEIALKYKGKAVRPIDIAVSNNGKKLYVTENRYHKVLVYSPGGKLLADWGGAGSNPGEFRYPATLQVDKKDRLYVVDVFNTRVQVFEPNGELHIIVGSWGVLPGQLFRPKGVAVSEQGDVFVSDSYLGVVEVFDSDTRFSHVYGAKEASRFKTPVGIAVGKDKRLYVTEMLKHAVSVYKMVK